MRLFSNVVRKAWHSTWFAMLLALCVVPCACAAEEAPAAAGDSTIAIRDNWPERFRDTLRYRRVGGTTYPDGRKAAREYRATIDIVMHPRRGDEATLSWAYTHMTQNGKPLADLKLELSVTREGVVELLNVDELQRRVLEASHNRSKGERPFDLGGEELAKVAANKDVLANFYLRDAVIFFYHLGTTLRRDEVVEFDNEVAGIGGETLKTVDSWKLLPERDLPAGAFAVAWVQEVDPDDLMHYFAQLGEALGMKVDAKKSVLSKNGLYMLDRRTFWPHIVLVTVEMKVQEGYSQLDLVDMRSKLLDPNWKH